MENAKMAENLKAVEIIIVDTIEIVVETTAAGITEIEITEIDINS